MDQSLSNPGASQEARFLWRPPGAPHLANRDLESALRLALVATSALEQAIIAWHTFHRLTLEQTAERLGESPGRVLDLFENLTRRVELAEADARRQGILPPKKDTKHAR